MWMRSLALLSLASVLLPAPALSAVPGTEEFTGGLNGWGPNTTSSTVVHIAAGGNPGGFIETRKELAEPVFDIGALTSNPNFTGNYAAAGIGRVSVDLNFRTANITGAWVRYRIDGVTNGWLHPLTAAFPTNVWNTYTVDFDPTWTDLVARANGWITDDDLNPAADPSPAFAAVLASVGDAEVRIGSPATSTLVDIDNYTIAVPEPSSAVLAICCLAAIALATAVRRRAKPISQV